MSHKMEDELRKRMTDCVYFLASPLTCKKGMECEFRHNEIARLNPRDCWYWLAGNCPNPTCGFRHPPLEGQPENSTEPASLPLPAAVPVSKSSIPCYFYFSGFCNKGDNCPFLHGSNSVTSGQLAKAASTVANSHLSENKAPASIEGVSPSTKPHFNQLENMTKASEGGIQFQSKAESQPSDSNNILQQSPSPQTSSPEFDGPMGKPELLHPAEIIRAPLVVDGSSPCGELSSEDRYDGHREPEERWESSPGFDVLVDDGSEKLGYEDDSEYVLAHNRDDMLLHEHMLQYDYEDPVGYSPHEYPESGKLYEHGMYGSYENLDDDNNYEHVRRPTKRSRERILSPVVHSKRRHLSKEIDVNDRNGSDLRNHLRSRRTASASRSKRHSSSHQRARSQDRSERRHKRRPVQERLASDFRSDIIGRHSEDDSPWKDWSRQSHPRYTQSRQQEREKRRQVRSHFLSSGISNCNTISQDSYQSQETSTTFSGPKTLAQIKEEKLQARENRDGFGSTTGNTMAPNFEGPRPLSEILKNKRRLTSDDSGSGRSRNGQF